MIPARAIRLALRARRDHARGALTAPPGAVERYVRPTCDRRWTWLSLCQGPFFGPAVAVSSVPDCRDRCTNISLRNHHAIFGTRTTRYGMSTTVPLEHGQAIERAREALAKKGFGVLAEMDIAATLKQKLNVEFRPT